MRNGECYKSFFLTRFRQGGTESIVEEWLLKRYEGIIIRIEREKKWDLNLVSWL